MRYPTFPTLLIGILFGAVAAPAAPILVSLEDPLAFADDHGFSRVNLLNEEDYRIHRADYFRLDGDGWTGYGYNLLHWDTPPDMGGYMRYREVRFFSSPGQTLIRQGAWSSFRTEEAPHFATLPTGHDPRNSDLPLDHIGETAIPAIPAVPEPGSLALFGLGLVAVAGVSRLRRKR